MRLREKKDKNPRLRSLWLLKYGCLTSKRVRNGARFSNRFQFEEQELSNRLEGNALASGANIAEVEIVRKPRARLKIVRRVIVISPNHLSRIFWTSSSSFCTVKRILAAKSSIDLP